MGARLSKGAKAKANTAALNPLRFVCTHKSHQIRTTEMVAGLQRIWPNIGEHSRASSETCTDKHANMRACIAPHDSTLPYTLPSSATVNVRTVLLVAAPTAGAVLPLFVAHTVGPRDCIGKGVRCQCVGSTRAVNHEQAQCARSA